ncbi:MAG: hypothetical protein HQ530_00130 [Parcubacteria group bacterium]|nr:hypothetical protein [Parcubacteria group bacterium]
MTAKNATIQLEFGDVTEKKIKTPNDFVSHMIEHIAWRLGYKIELEWNNEDWRALGKALGEKIKEFEPRQQEAAAVGMIDDGSAEVSVQLGESGLEISAAPGVDKDWFLNSRCEQVSSGEPLTDMLEGLSEGIKAKIAINIGNLEDPHHTWEGIYRSVGIALGKIYTPTELVNETRQKMAVDKEIEDNCSAGELSILARGTNYAEVRRGTAETGVTVGVDFTGEKPQVCNIEVADSIGKQTKNVPQLLEVLAQEMGVTLQVDFKAKALSSSHVVLEDIGLVTGRALLEVLQERMTKYGMNGAGSNCQTPADLTEKSVTAAISIEGRKTWSFIAYDGDQVKLKKEFLIGQNVLGIYSEDLDDFIDGLTGGLTASVMIHVKDYSDPEQAWIETFKALGQALRETYVANPYRKGVPAGVKATLA